MGQQSRFRAKPRRGRRRFTACVPPADNDDVEMDIHAAFYTLFRLDIPVKFSYDGGMLDLVKLFSPVATPRKLNVPITYVGIDVAGTLVDPLFGLDEALEDFYKFLLDQKCDARTLSTEPAWGEKELRKLRADRRIQPVLRRDDFHRYLEERDAYYIAIDDTRPDSDRAALIIHPESPQFRKFLEERQYESFAP